MKELITDYTFSKTAKTITFTNDLLETVDLSRILLITDTTAKKIIYNPYINGYGGTVSGNVLTLQFNTNTPSYSDSDKLQIYYDKAISPIQVVDDHTRRMQAYYPELVKYMPNARALFCDEGFTPEDWKGWDRMRQASDSVLRYDFTLAPGYFNQWCLEAQTPNAAGATVYVRKSKGALTLPSKVTKLAIGLYFTWHSWWQYGFYQMFFGIDTQRLLAPYLDSANQARRQWYKGGYRVSTAGSGAPFQNYWMYDSKVTDGTPNWVPIPYAANTSTGFAQYSVPWNEPGKEMWAKVVLIIDYSNGKLLRMIVNDDLDLDLSNEAVDATDVILANVYDNGANMILGLENRTGGTANTINMSNVKFDRITLAYERQ